MDYEISQETRAAWREVEKKNAKIQELETEIRQLQDKLRYAQSYIRFLCDDGDDDSTEEE